MVRQSRGPTAGEAQTSAGAYGACAAAVGNNVAAEAVGRIGALNDGTQLRVLQESGREGGAEGVDEPKSPLSSRHTRREAPGPRATHADASLLAGGADRTRANAHFDNVGAGQNQLLDHLLRDDVAGHDGVGGKLGPHLVETGRAPRVSAWAKGGWGGRQRDSGVRRTFLRNSTKCSE